MQNRNDSSSTLPDLSDLVSGRPKLADSLFDVLCDQITKGVLKPGQRLREAEVAEALKVSRTPLREALMRMEHYDLLERDKGGAYFVARWDQKTLSEVASLRTQLEVFAAKLASERLTDEDFEQLEVLIFQMESVVKRGDSERLIALDIQFHGYIWKKAGHRLLQQMLEGMKVQIIYFMVLTRAGDEVGYASMHRDFIAALKAKDAGRIEQMLQHHIFDTAERALLRKE